jgi:hypothetical protein
MPADKLVVDAIIAEQNEWTLAPATWGRKFSVGTLLASRGPVARPFRSRCEFDHARPLGLGFACCERHSRVHPPSGLAPPVLPAPRPGAVKAGPNCPGRITRTK